MATLTCSCSATPLTADGLQYAMDTLNIDAPTLWAMVFVETHGCGYFASRRPQILFERHLFSKSTGGQYDATAPDVSNPVAGGYGLGGENQYTRLAQAYALDSTAALASASWGLGQILGQHATHVGYGSVEDMVTAMSASEDDQLKAVVGYIQWQNLERALQQQDWAAYARSYNGIDYAKNQYDTRLSGAYLNFKDPSKRPDLTVRTAQMLLYLLGYDPHGVDGSIGAHTLTALHNFQAARGQTLTTGIDDGVIAALTAALPDAVCLAFV
ncbi:DUF3380 domain-containing protein [Acidobacteria bacterium AB60]|nr:DUF3380 domain-containing protein [Acidobacteria bacterium AB60]